MTRSASSARNNSAVPASAGWTAVPSVTVGSHLTINFLGRSRWGGGGPSTPMVPFGQCRLLRRAGRSTLGVGDRRDGRAACPNRAQWLYRGNTLCAAGSGAARSPENKSEMCRMAISRKHLRAAARCPRERVSEMCPMAISRKHLERVPDGPETQMPDVRHVAILAAQAKYRTLQDLRRRDHRPRSLRGPLVDLHGHPGSDALKDTPGPAALLGPNSRWSMTSAVPQRSQRPNSRTSPGVAPGAGPR